MTELLPRLPEWRTGKNPLKGGKKDSVEIRENDEGRLEPPVDIDQIERILQRLTLKCEVRGVQSNWYHSVRAVYDPS